MSELESMAYECCETCEHVKDEEGLFVCELDDRVKDEDMCCDKWEESRLLAKVRKKAESRHRRVGKAWNKLKHKALYCPECGSLRIGLADSYTSLLRRFYVSCEECYWCGNSRPTIRWAIHAWNKEKRAHE